MKTILHIDMNCYFVSVELINKPHLAKVPVIVGGKKKRGIVCSANYIARSYGVKAAMPVFSALKKCPNAVLVEPSLGLYSSYHEKFISLIKQNFTNHIEVASIDECYVDITNLIKKKSAQQIAIEIQNLLLSNLNLPCSIGIGNNKFMAKMGSNFKKPLGITQMYQQDKILKLWTLPVEKMHMVGKATSSILKRNNIFTIKDLAFANPYLLTKLIGTSSYSLQKNANGEGDDIVNQETNKPKSFSVSTTFINEIEDYDDIFEQIKKQTSEIWNFLNFHNHKIKTISLSIKKDYKTFIIRNYTNQNLIEEYEEFLMIFLNLFEKNFKNTKIKGLGCGVKIFE